METVKEVVSILVPILSAIMVPIVIGLLNNHAKRVESTLPPYEVLAKHVSELQQRAREDSDRLDALEEDRRADRNYIRRLVSILVKEELPLPHPVPLWVTREDDGT